ncbi:MAG: hypothetical protein U0401_05255 [Anaerolineae bacterium]
MPPQANDGSPPSHLFTVRLWLEELGHGQSEWRSQVQHVLSGASRYFRHSTGLVECLWAMLAELADDEKTVKPSREGETQ